MSEAVKKTRKRRGEHEEVDLGPEAKLQVTVAGGILGMSDEGVELVQTIRRLLDAHRNGDPYELTVGEEVEAARVDV